MTQDPDSEKTRHGKRAPEYRLALPVGYKFGWYRIEKVLGQGGFGITYLATNINLDRREALKEFVPRELVLRDTDSRIVTATHGDRESFQYGLRGFIAEARTLARLRHPNIVQVHNVFEANGTAYMSMEFQPGESLEEMLKRGKFADEASLRGLLSPLLDALRYMHSENFIHRDLKPANIVISPDGAPVILDFGSARAAMSTDSRTLTTMVTQGYAPFEQYHTEKGTQGPWTDIYGLGATMYRAVLGFQPIDAAVRGNARLEGKPDPMITASSSGKGKFSPPFLQCIDDALGLLPGERPADVEAWRDALDNAATVTGVARRSPLRVSAPKPTPRFELPEMPMFLRGRGLMIGTVIATVASLVAVLSFVFSEDTYQPADGVELPVLRTEGPLAPSPPEQSEDPAAAANNAAIARLMAKAEAALDAARLLSPPGDNAFEHFRAIGDIQPGHPAVQAGYERIVRRFIYLARDSGARHKYDKARAQLAEARRILPNDPRIDTAESDIAGAERRRAASLAQVATSVPAGSAATDHSVAVGSVLEQAPEIIFVKGGCFQMGSTTAEFGRGDDEDLHEVCVEDFSLGRYEVTFSEYAQFAKSARIRMPNDEGWGGGERPVVNVSWKDANAYAEWLSEQTGEQFRLPTEAEWEFAARGGTDGPFWTGQCIRTDQANYDGKKDYNNCGARTGVFRRQTLPIGSLAANPLGFHDILGNIWEWTCSIYEPRYEGEETRCADPRLLRRRVARGGSWKDTAEGLRVANRAWGTPSTGDNHTGFRVARGSLPR